MTISVKCPVCNAGNSLNDENQVCRRCKSDLSLLYQIKYHSYYNRLQAVISLINKDIPKANKLIEKAISQTKEN